MPNAAELVLVNSLTDVDALEELARQNLAPELVPTPDLYKIVDWAVGYFLTSGRKQAPSRVVLQTTWGTALTQMNAELEAEDVQLDTVRWAVGYLKAQYARLQGQGLITDFASALAGADEGEQAEVIALTANRMLVLAETVAHRPPGMNAAEGLADSLHRLVQRQQQGGMPRGLGLGLPAVDAHTGGIQRGELGTIISPQKTGKSMTACWVGLKHFEAGGAATVITLENTVASFYDRIACQVARVEYIEYQRGRISKEAFEHLKDWLSDNGSELAERLIIMRPDEAGSTAPAMCRTARLHDHDAVIIDQLSHVQLAAGLRYRDNIERTTYILRELTRALGDEDAGPLSGLLLAQASRAAAQAAKKNGSLGDQGGAGSSEVERAPDMLFGLHQSDDDEKVDQAVLELLEFRRGPKETWRLDWQPWRGHARVIPGVGGVSHAR